MSLPSRILTISIPEEMNRLIKDEQSRQGCSVSEIVRRALNVYFSGRPNKLPKRYPNTMRRQDYETR